jgi:hypothetical protein
LPDRVTIKIVRKGFRYSIPKVPGVEGPNITEALTLEGARHISNLIQAAAKRKGLLVIQTEEV